MRERERERERERAGRATCVPVKCRVNNASNSFTLPLVSGVLFVLAAEILFPGR